MFDSSIPDSSTSGKLIDFPIRQPWDSCGLGWYSPSEPGSAVRYPDSSTGSGNEPCKCANPIAIHGMRGFFPTSTAYVKCPPPQDTLPSLDLGFREKRLAGQPPPRRRAQTLKSPPNRAFYEFSRRAAFSSSFLAAGQPQPNESVRWRTGPGGIPEAAARPP